MRSASGLRPRDDDRALVRATLAAGEDVTQTNAYLRTPLHKAAYYSGDPGVIAELIDRGAIVDARDKGDWTPLHLAVIAGNVRGARMLVERGADPGALDRSGANVRTLLEENDVDPASVLGDPYK